MGKDGKIVYCDCEGFLIYYVGFYNDDIGYYEGMWEYSVYCCVFYFFKKKLSLGIGIFWLKKVEDE